MKQLENNRDSTVLINVKNSTGIMNRTQPVDTTEIKSQLALFRNRNGSQKSATSQFKTTEETGTCLDRNNGGVSRTSNLPLGIQKK
jgi:hypothetical protein